jgi:hypothetical protein
VVIWARAGNAAAVMTKVIAANASGWKILGIDGFRLFMKLFLGK